MHVLLDETSGVPGEAEMRKEDEGLEEEYRQTMY
jgi:hypothetical protein